MRVAPILLSVGIAVCVFALSCSQSGTVVRDAEGKTPVSKYAKGPKGGSHLMVGKATYYADRFHGRKTANGEIYVVDEYTAAHKTLPFGTVVRVVDLDTNRSVVVTINDRGPYPKGRIIDLSRVAAEDLGMIRRGVVPVRVEILKWGNAE